MIDAGDTKCGEMPLSDEEVAVGRRYVRLSFVELQPVKRGRQILCLSSLGKIALLVAAIFLAYCAVFWTEIFRDLFKPHTAADYPTGVAMVNTSGVRHADIFPCCATAPPLTFKGDEICTGQKGGTHSCCLVCEGPEAESPKAKATTNDALNLGTEYNTYHTDDKQSLSVGSKVERTSVSFLDEAPCCVLHQEGDRKGNARCPMDEHNTCCKVC